MKISKDHIVYGLYGIFAIGAVSLIYWLISQAGEGNIMAIVVLVTLFNLVTVALAVGIFTGAQMIMFKANAAENRQIVLDQQQINKAVLLQNKALAAAPAPQTVSQEPFIIYNDNAFDALEA